MTEQTLNNTWKCFIQYYFYALAIFVSEISLIQMRQQLMHKYHTPTLSMKYLSTFNQLASSKVQHKCQIMNSN